MKREIICIACPIGCALTVDYSTAGERIIVTGNRCSRGEIYAREEVLAPKRVVTATVLLSRGHFPRIPVRTDRPLQKELIPALLAELYRMHVDAPIETGDLILGDFRGTGVSVLATRNSPEGEPR